MFIAVVCEALCFSFFSLFLVYIFIADNISISLYIMCYTMLIQRFEPQGRRFTNTIIIIIIAVKRD